jgi:hypothetical protein
MDYFQCMALQSLKLRLCCGQFRFSHHLWRPPLYGNEVALGRSMGQFSGHVVCVARLIEANVPDRVIRVPEVDKPKLEVTAPVAWSPSLPQAEAIRRRSKRTLGDKGPDVVKKHGGQFLVRTDKITPLRAAEPAI